ncbi:methyltransferase [Micromonospora rosaria]|uniref:methyltransferase n=1 Tax=Micromonospora rosaria TaxID=47874 RepID=UPI000A8A80E1|nr:methyltransferase [Micromonospora rosaria]
MDPVNEVTADRTFTVPKGRAARLLPALFRAVGFTAEQVVATLGATDPVDLVRNTGTYALLTDHLSDQLCRTPAGLLTQLFVRNAPVPADDYRTVLPEELRRALYCSGIVTGTADLVRGRFSVTPVASRYFLSDQLFAFDDAGDVELTDGVDVVLPPHASSMALLRYAAEAEPGGPLIDVGSGCGVLGVSLAARHRSLTALDVNPRAAHLSRVNAELNGVAARVLVEDVTTGGFPVPDGSLLLFNTPTTIRYADGGRSSAAMPPRRALESVVGLLPAGRGCHARLFLVVEVPRGVRSASDLVASWLTDVPVDRLDVREIRDSAAFVPAAMIPQGRVGPQCPLLRHGGDAPPLARHLRDREVHEVVPVTVSVSR